MSNNLIVHVEVARLWPGGWVDQMYRSPVEIEKLTSEW